jgi:hypothetical protein
MLPKANAVVKWCEQASSVIPAENKSKLLNFIFRYRYLKTYT